MDQIQHTYVKVNGLNIHLAEIGVSDDKVVLFLHGLPEIWCSWRHQLIATGEAGFRAIALDFRGYGLSDAPPEPEKATFKDTISDLLAILDAFTIPKESGRAEADFARFDAKTIVRNVYILFSRTEIPMAVQDQEIIDLVKPSTPLPSWFSEEDLQVYGDLYEKLGFRTALKVP